MPSNFFTNTNLCVKAGTRTLWGTFCTYAQFINEAPGYPSSHTVPLTPSVGLYFNPLSLWSEGRKFPWGIEAPLKGLINGTRITAHLDDTLTRFHQLPLLLSFHLSSPLSPHLSLACSHYTLTHTSSTPPPSLSPRSSLSPSQQHHLATDPLPWKHLPPELATFPVTVATGSLQNFKHATWSLSLFRSLSLSVW